MKRISAQKKTTMIISNGKTKCHFKSCFSTEAGLSREAKFDETIPHGGTLALPPFGRFVLDYEMGRCYCLFHSLESLWVRMHDIKFGCPIIMIDGKTRKTKQPSRRQESAAHHPHSIYGRWDSAGSEKTMKTRNPDRNRKIMSEL
jgi:hypothetical protein